MRTLRVSRPQEKYNHNLKYKILIDGYEITRLANGEQKLIQLQDNAKVLQASFSSGYSKKLLITDLAMNKNLVVSGNAFKSKYLKFAGAILPLLGLTFILKHDYQIITILGSVSFVAYLLLVAYILIFQRRNWLNIRLID